MMKNEELKKLSENEIVIKSITNCNLKIKFRAMLLSNLKLVI